VTPQGTPNMTVQVAAGAISAAGHYIPVAAVSSLAIGANSSGNPRIDLVVVSNLGVVSVIQGTAAAADATSAPFLEFPAYPATSVLLAAVYVPSGLSAVTAAEIFDKRVSIDSNYASGGDLCSTSNIQTFTLTANTFVDVPGMRLLLPGGVPMRLWMKALIFINVTVAFGSATQLGVQFRAVDDLTGSTVYAGTYASYMFPGGVTNSNLYPVVDCFELEPFASDTAIKMQGWCVNQTGYTAQIYSDFSLNPTLMWATRM